MQQQPRLDTVQCLRGGELRRMAYWEWGDLHNPVTVVCVHGLTRQGRDFDVLAQTLSADYRVVCPDVFGRGHSDWLTEPSGYQLAGYVADMVTLIARINAQTLYWVGTSMGGLIGIGVASLPQSPISRLVLNDVGPTIEPAAVARIGAYVGQPIRWATEQEAADYMYSISKGFGPHTPEQWFALSRPMLRPADEGGFKLHYDPNIGVPFRAVTPAMAAAGEAALWAAYDSIKCPTLVIRGAESDLLSAKTAQLMTQRGPRALLRELAGVGHAPTLIANDQVALVQEFLRGS